MRDIHVDSSVLGLRMLPMLRYRYQLKNAISKTTFCPVGRLHMALIAGLSGLNLNVYIARSTPILCQVWVNNKRFRGLVLLPPIY